MTYETSTNNIDEKLDMLFADMDVLISNQQWDELDKICKTWDLSCGIDLTLGLLTITLPPYIKLKLSHRSNLFKRATIYYNVSQTVWIGLE